LTDIIGKEDSHWVFAGGYISTQFTLFVNAIEALYPLMRANGMDLRSVVEIQHVQDMRLLQWSPNDLVDWLATSDIHFILTHPHQGNPRWNVAELHVALQRLRYHPGFPHGAELDCPVFLQHKYAYLLGVRQFVKPTVAVQFPPLDQTVDALEKMSMVFKDLSRQTYSVNDDLRHWDEIYRIAKPRPVLARAS
jgi:hypothetical protein